MGLVDEAECEDEDFSPSIKSTAYLDWFHSGRDTLLPRLSWPPSTDWRVDPNQFTTGSPIAGAGSYTTNAATILMSAADVAAISE